MVMMFTFGALKANTHDLYHTIPLYYYAEARDNLRISEFERGCVQLNASSVLAF